MLITIRKYFDVKVDLRRRYPQRIEDVARMLIAAAKQPGCRMVEGEFDGITLCATRTRTIEGIVQDYEGQKGILKHFNPDANVLHRAKRH